jgi:cellobiose phosphorylase
METSGPHPAPTQHRKHTLGAVNAETPDPSLNVLGNGWLLFAMINPGNHARSAGETATYKAEPYAAAADVYAAPPHTGRGGWTWYTGSAAWMYRSIVESLLGIGGAPEMIG